MLERQLAENVIQHFWAGRPVPIDPMEIAQRAGIELRSMSPFQPGYDPTISGAYTNDGERPIIWYNLSDTPNRQRFTVAHELGHHFLQHGPRFRDTSATLAGGSYDPVEVAANRFAAELLMPAYTMNVLVVDRGVTSVDELSSAMQVSEQAMIYRLKNLGYIR